MRENDYSIVFEIMEISKEMENLVMQHSMEAIGHSEESVSTIAKSAYSAFITFLKKMIELLKRLGKKLEKFILAYSHTLSRLVKDIPNGQVVNLPKGAALSNGKNFAPYLLTAGYLPSFRNEFIRIADGLYENVINASRGDFGKTYTPNLAISGDFQIVLKSSDMQNLLKTIPHAVNKNLQQRLKPYKDNHYAVLLPLHGISNKVDLLGINADQGISERFRLLLDEGEIAKKASLDMVSTDDYIEGANSVIHQLKGPYEYIYNLQDKMVSYIQDDIRGFKDSGDGKKAAKLFHFYKDAIHANNKLMTQINDIAYAYIHLGRAIKKELEA